MKRLSHTFPYIILSILPMFLSAQGPLVVNVENFDQRSFENLREIFVQNNPEYDLMYHEPTMQLDMARLHRVAFVQEGGANVSLSSGETSHSTIGDIILLNPGVSLEADSLIGFLVFRVPDAFPNNIPVFVRPDWDPNITDVPGGCATETGAYRRILLTWLGKVGPYNYHALNCHRVRIMDSFTHYHPIDHGFDEFYLVQMAMPGAKLITSSKVEAIENPEKLTAKEAKELLHVTSLKVGDLIYLPRGMAHRGLDGVLAQVITAPGFVPKSEIGVDHHLKRINELLSLKGKDALPYNKEASKTAVVK